jgi:hypothetical protein
VSSPLGGPALHGALDLSGLVRKHATPAPSSAPASPLVRDVDDTVGEHGVGTSHHGLVHVGERPALEYAGGRSGRVGGDGRSGEHGDVGGDDGVVHGDVPFAGREG